MAKIYFFPYRGSYPCSCYTNNYDIDKVDNFRNVIFLPYFIKIRKQHYRQKRKFTAFDFELSKRACERYSKMFSD